MMMRNTLLVFLVASGCTADVSVLSEDTDATSGASVGETYRLSGCRGQASSAIPADGRYTITTFGGPGDHQSMSCGGYADGTGWYAASRQRYGCGAHVKVQANGKCVVLKTDDYGPDVCVENAAHMPIIDVSPRASQHLFGTSGAGWSDHMVVTVEQVPASTPLGICQPGGTTTPPSTTPTATTCDSATLDRTISEGTCVQSATDALMYKCVAGAMVQTSSGCSTTYRYCSSATLGINVPPRTCVQAASNSVWYQCNGTGWVTPVDVAGGEGPIGACSTMHPL